MVIHTCCYTGFCENKQKPSFAFEISLHVNWHEAASEKKKNNCEQFDEERNGERKKKEGKSNLSRNSTFSHKRSQRPAEHEIVALLTDYRLSSPTSMSVLRPPELKHQQIHDRKERKKEGGGDAKRGKPASVEAMGNTRRLQLVCRRNVFVAVRCGWKVETIKNEKRNPVQHSVDQQLLSIFVGSSTPFGQKR